MGRNVRVLGIAGWRPAKLARDLPRSSFSYPVRRSLELFENFFNGTPPRVLDIGCGDGSKLSCFHPFIGQSVGIDLPAEVSRTSNLEHLSVAASANFPLPFPNNAFDAVTNFHVLEHLIERDLVINEMYRVLKPGGWLMLITPNRWRITALYSNWALKFFKRGIPHPMNPDHTFEYTRRDLQRSLEQSEFVSQRVEPLFLGLMASFGERNYWVGLEQVPSFLDRFCSEWLVIAQKPV